MFGGYHKYPVPPALAHFHTRTRILCAILAGPAMVIFLGLELGWLPDDAQFGAKGIAWLLGIATIVYFWNRTRGFYKRLRSFEFEMCLNCGYLLKGLPSKHKCPECGDDYAIEKVRSAWKQALRWIRHDDDTQSINDKSDKDGERHSSA